MLYFSKDVPIFRQCGLAIFFAQLSIFVFGLAPFRAGYWLTSEPQLLATFILAAITCMWLWVGLYKEWLFLLRPVPYLARVMLAWVGWQVLVTLCMASPWRSWFGAPENSESTAWFLSVLFCAMLVHPLWQHIASRRTLLILAAIPLVVLCALHVWQPHPKDYWNPQKWPDYMAFMFGYGWLALMAHATLTLRRYLALAVLCAIGLLIASNDAGSILISYVLLLNGLMLWIEKNNLPHFQSPGKVWRLLAMGACLLPMGWVLASMHDPWFPNHFKALGSRAVLNQIGVATVMHEPNRLWLGHGWGSFVDDSFKYAILPDVHHFKDGVSSPNAQNVLGGTYHSHNQPLEVLLAMGVPGLLLWFALPMVALWQIPQRLFWRLAPMIGALTALSYFWFTSVQALAYVALGWAVLCAVCIPAERPQPRPAQWLSLLFIPLIFLMLWTSWQHYSAMRYGERLWQAIHTMSPTAYTQAMITDDIRRGGDRQWTISREFLLQTVNQQHRADADTIGWFRQLLSAAHTMGESPSVGANNASLELLMQTMLMANITNPAFSVLDAQAHRYFPQAVVRLAKQAPQREDYAAIYLFMLKKNNDQEVLPGLLKQLLEIEPDHRIALWLVGQSLSQTHARKSEGEAMMRRALALGVDRVYPLTSVEMSFE